MVQTLLARREVAGFRQLEFFLGLAMVTILAWFAINDPRQAVKNASLALALIGTLSLLLMIADRAGSRDKLAEWIGFGNKVQAQLGIVVGIIFGVIFFILVSGELSNFAVVVPFAAAGSTGFLVIFAAYVEEMFFRNTLTPTMETLFAGMGFGKQEAFAVAVGLGAIAFGIFHFLAYQALIGAMIGAVVFGLLMIILNWFFKSSTFNYGAHIIYNLAVLFALGIPLF